MESARTAGDEGENDVLGQNPPLQSAVHPHLVGLRFHLQQALRGKHVFHLAGADAKGQGAECAVSGRVAVAANHRHAGLGQAELWADHVHNALAIAMNTVEADAELPAILVKLFDLLATELIDDGQRAVGRRNAVVDRGQCHLGTADFQTALAEALEGLRGSDFVDQVQVDVDQRGCARLLVDHVRIPEFFDDGSRHKVLTTNIRRLAPRQC
jgi:hypothetical protein